MKKTFVLLFLGCSLHVFAQKDYASTYNSYSIIQAGIALYEEGKFSEAITEFDKVAKVDPKFITAQYEKGLALVALEKKDDARKLFEELFENKGMVEEPRLFTLYASFLSDEKEYDKAELIFKEGEKITPNSGNLLYNYAILKYRKEDQQGAVDLLKKVITFNPNATSAHYLLAAICLDNGKITEATLAFMSYLMLAPTTEKAREAVVTLNKKFGENFLEKSKVVFSKSGDNFEDIDAILRSQLPLKKAYKVKSDIDDVAIRQIQAVVEYAADHKIGDGFFETTYIPWIKELAKQNQFEGYSYYMLLSLEESLGKKLTSKKKNITDFYKNFVEEQQFWSVFGLRKVEHYGKVEEVLVSNQNSVPYLLGKVVNKKSEGKYKFFDEHGNVSGDLNFVNDELDGVQKYYDEKGRLSEEKTFKNNKLNGTKTAFYDNGEIKSVENYKDGVTDGLIYSKHAIGGKQCEGNFVNGEREGKFTCYYSDGSKKSEINYSKGKLNGSYTLFNELGDITGSYNYVNDELDGKYTSYYIGKKIKSEAIYSKGKIQGSYKSYFIDGILEEEIVYENGKIKKSTENYENGNKSIESIYDENEKIQTYIYFNSKGEPYYQENFKGGEIKSGMQYSKGNPKPVETAVAKKAFTIKNLENKILLTGEYNKGDRTGEWKYYYKNGNLKNKRNYKSNNLEGLYTNYKKNGALETIFNYTNDTLSGRYEVYEKDVLIKEQFYADNERNGPYKQFYPDGTLREEGIYLGDELYYYRNFYWMNGMIKRKDKFAENELLSTELYSTAGKKETEFEYRHKTGKFNVSFHNQAVTHSVELLNGNYHGKYIIKDKFNSVLTETEYVNGARNGIFKSYGPTGALDYESNFYAGYSNGMAKTYDLVGNLKYAEESIFGTEYGSSTRYYVNKSKLFEFKRINGDTEGEYKYYNMKGEVVLIVGYEYDIATYYVKFNAAGELKERVEIENETASMVSKYANGTTAVQLNLVKGAKDGKFAVYNATGKPEVEIGYAMNDLEGERKEYYPNGNVYRIERLKNNNYEGIQEYYKEDGKIWLKAEYKNDELHGNTLIYTNGILSQTKKYDSDELVEISK